MYGPKWPFLLMYGSHDMRHIGFPRIVNGPPRFGASQIACLYMIGSKRRILVKNKGKGQNPGILIKIAITTRKNVTSRSVSSCRIRRRNSRTNKERNLVMPVLWNHIRLMENF